MVGYTVYLNFLHATLTCVQERWSLVGTDETRHLQTDIGGARRGLEGMDLSSTFGSQDCLQHRPIWAGSWAGPALHDPEHYSWRRICGHPPHSHQADGFSTLWLT